MLFVVIFALIALTHSRAVRRDPSRAGNAVFDNKGQVALWSMVIGAVFLGVGAFTAESGDLKSFIISLGVSVLAAGLGTVLSL